MSTLIDAVTSILCKDMKDCLSDYGVDEELVRNDPEFGMSMRLTAEHILQLVENGTFKAAE